MHILAEGDRRRLYPMARDSWRGNSREERLRHPSPTVMLGSAMGATLYFASSTSQHEFPRNSI